MTRRRASVLRQLLLRRLFVRGIIQGSRDALILLLEQNGQALAFEHVQAAQDLCEREFILEIDLKIYVGAQPILVRLAILCHQDNRGLQTGDDTEDQIEQVVRICIELLSAEEPRVEQQPKKKKKKQNKEKKKKKTED